MPFSILRQIAEERIKEAMERGEFECEKYKGKPLDLREDPFVPEDLRVVYRILKNAGFLPKEVELRKEIYQTIEELLDEEHQETYQKVRKLSALLFHLNQIRERPLNIQDEEYYAKVVEKIKVAKKIKLEEGSSSSKGKPIDFSRLQTLLSIKAFIAGVVAAHLNGKFKVQ
jgi:Domain of unknown function (DUF1992).